MPSRRCLWNTISCLLLAAVAGCAQSGPMLSRGTGVGTLKTSLSHMEYENQQLRRELASLKAEVRDTEDQLVQEETANGELSSRLDNALAMLKQRGALENGVAEGEPNSQPPRTTLPAGRSTRKGRKPPFAQIRNQIESLPSEDDKEPAPRWGVPSSSSNEPSVPQSSRLDNPAVWLPVARGTTAPTTSRR